MENLMDGSMRMINSISNSITKLSRRSFNRLLATLIFSGAITPSLVHAMPRTRQELVSILDRLTKTGLVHGDIPSLNSPQYLSVGEASMSIEALEPVFMVPLGEDTYIFPQKILVYHEVVNEVLRNHAYCISYSPLAGCMAAYDASIAAGYNLIFDSEGRLFNANSVLIDRNTGSLWAQLLGMAFDGPLTGTGLKILPSYWTTWRKAKEFAPKAKVLSSPRGSRRSYGRDPYGSYLAKDTYYTDERLLHPMVRIDSRMHPKAPILGLEIENNMVSIDIAQVKERKLINFYAGLVPLVALWDDRLDVARVYNRQVWEGEAPSLFVLDNATKLRDVMTHSLWNGDGQCLEGKLQGVTMPQYFGIYAFWVMWAAFHPETIMVPGATVVPDDALVRGNVG